MVSQIGQSCLVRYGIAVAPSGITYLADRGTSDQGKVFKLEGSTLTAVINQIHMGNPAGVGLSPDAAVWAVSTHQPNSFSDEVLLVNLSTGQTGAVTKVVGQNSQAGGLHVSPSDKKIFSWADIQGTIYCVRYP